MLTKLDSNRAAALRGGGSQHEYLQQMCSHILERFYDRCHDCTNSFRILNPSSGNIFEKEPNQNCYNARN